MFMTKLLKIFIFLTCFLSLSYLSTIDAQNIIPNALKNCSQSLKLPNNASSLTNNQKSLLQSCIIGKLKSNKISADPNCASDNCMDCFGECAIGHFNDPGRACTDCPAMCASPNQCNGICRAC